MSFFFYPLSYNFGNSIALLFFFFWQLHCFNFFFLSFLPNNFGNYIATLSIFFSPFRALLLFRALPYFGQHTTWAEILVTTSWKFIFPPRHIISLSSLILFLKIFETPLPKFASLLIFSKKLNSAHITNKLYFLQYSTKRLRKVWQFFFFFFFELGYSSVL